jgi:hypothetical protein
VSAFPGSPLVLKGAIIGISPTTPVPSVVIFQYNPDSVSRQLQVDAAGNAADTSEPLRVKGPPKETITLEAELDAADQLEVGNPVAATLGIAPALASLEALLYPSSATMIANDALALAGVIEVLPPEAPLTILAWGPARVVPVRLNSLGITEHAFDTLLNPIRADVSMSLQVLSYQDLGMTSAGGAISLVHHVAVELMGKIGEVSGAAATASFSIEAGL